MSQISYSKYKYIPDEIDEKTFLEKFVVRTEIFDDIFEDIKETDYTMPCQHYIIIGQRGQGKTSLLRKIQLEINKDEELSKFLLPVKFAEEQYQIRSLCRLWEEVAEYLQTIYDDEFGNILDDMEEHIDDDDYELRCFFYLDEKIKKQDKKLLLLIDNIDELLGKLKEKEQKQLREILLSSSSFRIIGGSTKMIEQHYDYSKTFYEFFQIVKLQGLDYKDSIRFLRTIGEDEQKEKIEAIIKNTPERIETLRQLTGGVPRTLVMLYDIFVDDDNGNAFEDLLKVLNDATPLYKDRMDSLPPVLQDIVHNIAMNWDGITTKEIAKKTRLESKAVSSQLKQLEKYQIIEFESMGKNKIYKIQERFFNIWYLIRFGRKKDRNKVEWLVKFLLSWYTHDELEDRAKRFSHSLKNGQLNESYVFHMSEALSYSGLEMETEDSMKQNVKKYLINKDSTFAKELSKSDKDLLIKVIELQNENNANGAIKLLENSGKNSKSILFALGILYKEQKEYDKAEQYYLQAIESGDNDALRNLGNLYSEQKEYDKAEQYYLQAIESGDNGALNSLSWHYFEEARNIDKSIHLIHKSYENKKGFHNTHTLATILLWAEKFEQSYEKFIECLHYDVYLEYENDIILYLNLLISKGQFYKAKEFFEMPEYQFKDRYKPIWYALMTLMQDDFPNEIKKMGSELKQSVSEILIEIEDLKEKYSLKL